LAPVGVGSEQHAVDAELKELLLIGTDGRRHGSRNNRPLQIIRGLRWLCAAPDEELIVNIGRAESVESESWFAPKIATLG
jgi:hypothetical protein